MKNLFVVMLFSCSTLVCAQDVIVKRDGSTILSKVLEVNTSEIKYKKFSNQDGPTYTINKSEIIILILVSLWIYMRISLGYIPKTGMSDCMYR